MPIRCRLHPSEFITNFCCKDQCLVELCATCICHHTEMHAQLNSLPDYQNITHTMARAGKMIDSQRIRIEEERKSILQFHGHWDSQKDSIFQTLNQAKKEVLQIVQRTFSQIWTNYERNIMEEQIRMGNSKGERIKNLAAAYQNQSDKLFNIQKDLGTANGPSILKKIFTESIPLSNQLMDTIKQKYRELQKVQIGSEFRVDKLMDVKHSIISCLSFKRSMFRDDIYENSQERERINLSRSVSNFSPKPRCHSGSQIVYPLHQSNGNSRIFSSSKPKMTVISNLPNPSNQFSNTQSQLLRSSRRSNIFQKPPFVNNISLRS